MALRAGIEVQRVVPVEIAQALGLVLDHVRMHDVHNDGDALGMRGIHQGLELLGGAETGTEGEDVGDLVAEGTVVGMLLKGHDLEDVVSQLRDLGQDVAAELVEGGDSLLLTAHSDVALVDEGIGTFAGTAVLPDVGLPGVPDLGAEGLGIGVLDGARDIRGQTLAAAADPLDIKLVEVAVGKEHLRQPDLPVAAADGFQGIAFGPVPVVEIANQADACRIGRPFAENPAAVLRMMETVEEMVVYSGGKGAVAGDGVAFLEDAGVPHVDGRLERHQVRVGIVDHPFLHGISFQKKSRPFRGRCGGKPCTLRSALRTV